jgi:hypothetical protein
LVFFAFVLYPIEDIIPQAGRKNRMEWGMGDYFFVLIHDGIGVHLTEFVVESMLRWGRDMVI